MKLEQYKKIHSRYANNIGAALKNQSDMIIESTWWNDIQSKKCYIYDYFHDSEKDKCYGMSPQTDPLKTQIDAKFIVSQYGSINKDQVEYHLQFKPSHQCELEYFTKNYVKQFDVEYPIGLYIDIPDEKNIYRKWLICEREYSNQFSKYYILPCDYKFKWVDNGCKYTMWGASRVKNSYNSGISDNSITSTFKEQMQMWMPMNEITQRIFYDQRFIISSDIANPITWKVTKLENAHPFGLNKITLSQDKFNPFTDAKDENGEWFADLNKSLIEPPPPSDDNDSVLSDGYSKLTLAGSNTIRVGGSGKTITATFYDNNNNIIDTPTDIVWNFTANGNDIRKYIDVQNLDSNKIKISISEEYEFLVEEVLTVTVSNSNALFLSNIQLEILSL